MDINEFVQRVQPRKKRSRLLPFMAQIEMLKKQGYTDQQIRDWLASNGVEVSREAVRKFWKNAKQGTSPVLQMPTAAVEDLSIEADSGEKKITTATTELSQAEKIRKKLDEQKRDAESKRFKHDKTGNI